MLHNNLHPDVAEKPGRARRLRRDRQGGAQLVRRITRSSASSRRLGRRSRRCSCSPVSRWRCSRPTIRRPGCCSPIPTSCRSGPTWETFRELDAAGLMMYGQMTAGSWIYIGSQGILQGTYETFAAAARKRFGGTLAGRLVVTAGLGGMGGAQPLAITMLERRGAVRRGRPAADRAPDRDRLPRRARRRPRRCPATAGRGAAPSAGPLSIGLAGNAAEVLPELVRRGVEIDVVTDQTSAHDPLNGYIPAGLTVEQAAGAAALRSR